MNGFQRRYLPSVLLLTVVMVISWPISPAVSQVAQQTKPSVTGGSVETHVGKLDVELFRKLQTMLPQETVRIGIWLTDVELSPDLAGRASPTASAEAIEGFQERKTRALVEAYQRHSQGIVDRVLRARGRITYVSRLAPLVFAEVPAHLINALENLPDVDTIYLENLTGGPELNIVTRTHRADWAWGGLWVGLNARGCVVEGGGIAPQNPFIAFGQSFLPATSTGHTTGVAGIIQSTANPSITGQDLRGHAWGALPILSGNAGSFTDSALVNATEWCVLNNFPRANAVNHSYFVNTSRSFAPLDRYLDHVVRAHAVLQVKSAGNRGLSDGNVTSPGKGWNVLTVGSFDDRDTSSFADDVISSFSSYVDPFRPGTLRVINKPEVAAVGCHNAATGVGIRSTTTASPWTGNIGCGTSFAAPAVVGTALVIHQLRPDLKFWPEPVKAIIMTAALHNIEGLSRFSDRDGAGGLLTYHAAAVARRTDRVRYKSFNPSTYAPTNELSFTRAAGQLIRCTLVWDSAPGGHAAGGTPTTDNLLTDMDLRVVRGDTGATIAWSLSVDNAFEIVQTAAPASTTYHIRVNRFSTSETSNFMGLACWL